MDMSDQNVSFGDFSGLEDADYQRVYQILHGGDPTKHIEFPWNNQDLSYTDDGELQPGFCQPVEGVPPIPGAPLFVPPYTVPGMYPVPVAVPPYPIVNGIPFPPQPIYPPAEGGPIPPPPQQGAMCNGPTVPIAVPLYNHQAPVPTAHQPPIPHAHAEQAPVQQTTQIPSQAPVQQITQVPTRPPVQQTTQVPTRAPVQQTAPVPSQLPVHQAAPVHTRPPVQQNAPVPSQLPVHQTAPVPTQAPATQTPEFDFVYSEPGSDVPVSTSSQLIQQGHTDLQNVEQGQGSTDSDPARTIDKPIEKQMGDVSIEKAGPREEKLSPNPEPPKKEATPDPSPTTSPPKKSWAGLFKGSTAIVTYIDDTKRDPSPQPITRTVEKKVEEATKMPVPVAEDCAAVELGVMLKTLKINHNSVALQPRGLVNRGNWCYINSTLQALVACPPFYHMMKQLCEFPPLTRGSSSTPILDSLIAFIKNFSPWVRNQNGMRGGKRVPELCPGSSFEPVNVYKMLQVIEANPSFKLGKQEDAEEFLNCILDGLHEEMATSISQASGGGGEEVHENGYLDEDQASEDEEDSWQQVGPKKKSVLTRRAAFAKTPVADIFAGHVRSAVYKAASKESATLEPFFTLKLDIQDEKIWTVRDALEGLVSRENVQGYQCSKTNQEVEVVKKISLEELPPVLILHLKCFVFDKTGGCQKLMKKIDFDVDLNITKDLLSSTAKAKITQSHRSYKLFAVVFHHGKNSTGGHYTTDVFHPGINSWVHIDDSRMQSVPVSAVLKYSVPRMPYLLYYRRTDLS